MAARPLSNPMNHTIILASRPVGLPTLDNFRLVPEPVPVPAEGELLLKTLYVSVDPYLRGRMNDTKSYIPPFELDEPISSGIISEVLESRNKNFRKGTYVTGMLAWKEQQLSDGSGLIPVDAEKAPLSTYLGVLGLTGLTAYLGLTEIGKPKKGETLLVSGAAGAVGSVVGQVGKLLGMRVVGLAGSDEKVALLKTAFGFDEGINYKSSPDLGKAIAVACPVGVDVYFDNVGGAISDAALFHLNTFARVVVCGAISVYNETSLPKGLAVQPFLIRKRALMQGFIVFDFAEKYPGALAQLTKWLQEGKLQHRETLREGFEAIPQAFIDLFAGKNKGKMIVKV